MFIWKFKMNLPSEGLLIVCSKISVISYFGMGVCWCSIPPPFLVGDRGCLEDKFILLIVIICTILTNQSVMRYTVAKLFAWFLWLYECFIKSFHWWRERTFFCSFKPKFSWVCKLSGVWQKWKYCVLGQVII